MIVLCFLGLLLQQPTSPPVRQTIAPRTTDTRAVVGQPVIRISPADDSVRRQIDSAYIAILEKTNQQLSPWWNPYGVMVAALGVLFASGAIVAGFLLFRQSREYREMIAGAIAQYQAVLDAMVKENLARLQVDLRRSIEEGKKELAAKQASDPERQKLETRIAVMEKQLEAVRRTEASGSTGLRLAGSGSVFEPVSSSSLGMGFPPEVVKKLGGLLTQIECATCGEHYMPLAWNRTGDKGHPQYLCPSCGAANSIAG
jgi:hypothetical protein